MSASVLAPIAEDYGEVETASFELIAGPAWAIQLMQGRLYREPHAHLTDPDSIQPTVWFSPGAAESIRRVVAGMLDEHYAVPQEGFTALRVVRVEMDSNGIWRPVGPVEPWSESYRPINPDTGKRSAWQCASAADLTVPQARQVMSDHRECAGESTCRIRGRARKLLAALGALKLVNAERAEEVWPSLHWPDQRPMDGAIGGSALLLEPIGR